MRVKANEIQTNPAQFHSSVAQLVEHLIVNQNVAGSCPARGVFVIPCSVIGNTSEFGSDIRGSSPREGIFLIIHI